VVVNGSSSISTDGAEEPKVVQDSVFGAGSDLPECNLSSSDPDGDGYGTENGAQCIVLTSLPGNTVYFENTVWNLGNSIDSYDITTANTSFPTGTVVRILQADGQTPLLDTSGNGVVDTGPVIPGGSYQIVLEVSLPAVASGNNAGEFYEVSTIATSIEDSMANNSIVNRLRNISSGAVDITQSAQANEPLSLGVGAGPEPTAVSTISLLAGESVLLDLYINNTSAFAMDYNLSASIHNDFSSVELPNLWRVQFLMQDKTIVSNTGIIGPGEFVLIQARVTVPAAATPSTVSIYFKAENERYSVSDTLHDELIVQAPESVLLLMSQEGQAQIGGSKVYSHTLDNRGSTDIQNMAISASNSLAAEGWSSVIFEDIDGDGKLSAVDQELSSTSLLAGEQKKILINVFVPVTAIVGDTNNTQLVASWGSEKVTLTDVTSVSNAEISVLKEQALDNGCDGILDSAYGSSVFSVTPGNNCVSYRLTASNLGSTSIHNVVVADATPAFTSYYSRAECSKAQCAITQPAVGGQGEVSASLTQLVSGDSVVVKFMVKVD